MTSKLPQYDLSCAEWRKSTRSQDASTCVEVARNLPGIVAVRDSKIGDESPILVFEPAAWRSFTAHLKMQA